MFYNKPNYILEEYVMPENGALISVIIPVYNTEAYLEKCVRSFMVQTDPDWEMLLVDDGSTDGSPALCDRLAAEDGRIRVLHQPNSGVSSARNRGLENARGAFIVFADSDDWVDPGLLAWYREQQAESGAELVSCAYTRHGAKGEERPMKPMPEIVMSADAYMTRALSERYGVILSVCLTMFAAKLIHNERFDTDLPYSEDALFYATAIAKARRVVYEAQPLYHYRAEREGNTVGLTSLRKQELNILAWERMEKVWRGKKEEAHREAPKTAASAALSRGENPAGREGDAHSLMVKILADYCIMACRAAYREGSWTKRALYQMKARKYAAALQQDPLISGKDRLRLKLAAAAPILGVDIYKRLKGDKT